MVIMAGMLPGVEAARRRRIRQSSSGGAEAGAARRPSLCLYAGGLGRDLRVGTSSSSAAAAASSKVWTPPPPLGSDAREAKERLDHKLRGQRRPVVLNRHQMTSTRPPPAKPHDDDATLGDGHHSATMPCGVLLHREVLPSSSSKPRGGCRFSWCRRRPPAAESELAEAECAVCLEELRAGDVVARLPCAHRFHWPCAVPWVQAVSRCPVCRAHVSVAAGTS